MTSKQRIAVTGERDIRRIELNQVLRSSRASGIGEDANAAWKRARW